MSVETVMLAGFAMGSLLTGGAVLVGCVVGFTAHTLSQRLRRVCRAAAQPYTADYPG